MIRRTLRARAHAVPLDHRLGQRYTHPVQLRPPERVLKARERRLRGERRARHRIAFTEQLVDRVTAQSARVVTIWLPAGNRIEPLVQQLPDCMANRSRLASIIDALDPPLTQPERSIGRIKQARTAIGAAVLLIEARHHRAAPKSEK